MINAHGISRPEKCGCASHIGVMKKKATIGITSSVLCGGYEKMPERIGEWAPLKYKDQTIGAIFRSKYECKPIVTSPGHLIIMEKSIELTKRFLKGHKFPEPLYAAHNIANRRRMELRSNIQL